LVVWCPDWPVVAAYQDEALPEQIDPAVWPVAVIKANRVVACSAPARAGGVQRGMRRREAQGRVPSVELVADDPSRDARWFEPVVAVLERFTPLIEVVRPGICQFATRGPSRYFGGDEALLGQVSDTLVRSEVDARIGIADGPFAANLAARATDVHVVPPGTTPSFLAPHSVRSLLSVGELSAELESLVEVWELLGLRTLGQIAELPAEDILARFGNLGIRTYDVARGCEPGYLNPTPIPVDLASTMELDPPIDRVEAAAFVAKGLAEELHDRLLENGLACTRIRIEAQTVGGSVLSRLWRQERAGAAGGLSAQGLADRIRWQLDGWLRRTDEAARQPLARITIAPDEVHPETGRQLGLWGGVSDADVRAARVFTRVQGMLGPDAVQIAVPAGGRSLGEGVRLVPWGDDPTEQRRDGLESTTERPWRGQVPPPLPTTVHTPALPADVRTEDGWLVQVSGRGELSGLPAKVSIARSAMGSLGQSSAISKWAGPWPVEDRWWDPAATRRRARLQIVTTEGRAHLLMLEGGQWWVEASYD
jgi:protein ImuB